MACEENDRNRGVKSTDFEQKRIGSEQTPNKIAKAPEQNQEMREEI